MPAVPFPFWVCEGDVVGVDVVRDDGLENGSCVVIVGDAVSVVVSEGSSALVVVIGESVASVVGELSTSGWTDAVLVITIVEDGAGGAGEGLGELVACVLDMGTEGEDEELGLDPAGTTVKFIDVAML